jgi:hypothetical protein
MRTKTKLTLAALGFVAATTGLVYWQATPPRLATAARLVSRERPFYDGSNLLWLSPNEILMYSGDLTVWNLVQGTQRPLFRIPTSEGFANAGADPTISPDGQWLLFVEASISKPLRMNWILVHPDGTDLRRVPCSLEYLSNPLWLPNSKGWMTYAFRGRGKLPTRLRERDVVELFYFVDPSIPAQEVALGIKALQFDQASSIQADGRFLYESKEKLTFSLCKSERRDTCELVTFTLPAEREKAEVQQSFLSHDSQTLLVQLRTEATPIPERETWELLLKRKFPVAYEELWVLSSHGGRARCLVREPLTNGQDYVFSLASLSPQGNRALITSENLVYYLTLVN